MKNVVTRALLAGGLLSATTAYAVDFNVNGFASIVAGKTTHSETTVSGMESTYLITPVHNTSDDGSFNEDAHYSDEVSFLPDTTLGLQLNADLGEGLSITAQMLAQGANDFNPDFEWVYVSYQATDDLRFNVGRQRLPLYMYSDYLDVGFAYHWLRAPSEIYEVPISRYEGISAVYNRYVGDWEVSTQAYYGNAGDDRANARFSNLTGVYGINTTISNEWAKARVSYNRSNDVVSNYGNNLLYREDDNMGGTFLSAGFNLTFDRAFVGGEYTYFYGDETLTLMPGEFGVDHVQALLLTAGYRVDNFTPHITYARNDNTTESYDIDGDGYVDPSFLFLDGKTSAVETITVGVRWDFHSSAALKAEYNFAQDDSSNALQAAIGEQNTASVFAVGLDLIF